MYQEGTFYAYTVGNTTNREGFTDTAVLTANNDAFKNLYTFTIAFDNLYVSLDGITRAKIRNVVAKLFLFKYANNVHFVSSYKTFVLPVAASYHDNRHTSRGLPKLTRKIISWSPAFRKYFCMLFGQPWHTLHA